MVVEMALLEIVFVTFMRFFILIFLFFSAFFITSCSKKTVDKKSVAKNGRNLVSKKNVKNSFVFQDNKKIKDSITQKDVDNFIDNNKDITLIIKKWNKLLDKTGLPSKKRELILQGKHEINSWLLAKELEPEKYMLVSKNIFKGYRALKILKKLGKKNSSYKILTRHLSNNDLILINKNFKKIENSEK